MATNKTATNNTSSNTWDIEGQSLNISNAGTSQQIGSDITLDTAGKFVDRNIVVKASTVSVPAASVSSTSLGYGETSTITTGFISTGVTIKNNIEAAELEVSSSSNTINVSVDSNKNASGLYPITGNSVTNSIKVNNAGYISDSIGTTINDTVSVSGTVAASTLTAESIIPGAEQVVTIGAGYYPSNRTVTIKSIAESAKANIGTTSVDPGTTYTTNDSAVVPSGGWLTISEGYIPATKISLATLVPDGTDDKPAASDSMLKDYKAYDNNGNLLTGSIPINTSDNITINGKSITTAAGYYAEDITKSVATSIPTIDEVQMTSAIQTADATSSNIEIKVPTGYIEEDKTINVSVGAAVLSANSTISSATLGALSTKDADLNNKLITVYGNVTIAGTANATTSQTGRAIKGTTTGSAPIDDTKVVSNTLTLYCGEYSIG